MPALSGRLRRTEPSRESREDVRERLLPLPLPLLLPLLVLLLPPLVMQGDSIRPPIQEHV